MLLGEIVIDPNQLLTPVCGLNGRGKEHGIQAASLGGKWDHTEESLDGRIIWVESRRDEVGTYTRAIARGSTTLVTEITGPLLNGRDRLIKVLPRNPVSAPLLRPEEEGMVLPNRPPDGVAKIVLLIRRNRRKEIVSGVEDIIANERIGVTMKTVGASFRFHLDRP